AGKQSPELDSLPPWSTSPAQLAAANSNMMIAAARENLRSLNQPAAARRAAARPALPAPDSPTDPAKPRSSRKKPTAKKPLPDLSLPPVLEVEVAPSAVDRMVARQVQAQTAPPVQAPILPPVQVQAAAPVQAQIEQDAKPRRKFSLLRALAEFDVLHAMTLTV